MNFKKVSRHFATCRSGPEPDMNAAQIKATFQLTYTKSHPCCVEPTFVKTAFCLMRLY